MDGGLAEDATQRDAVALWERHFREPEASFARAGALLAAGTLGARARAWCELTIAYHHLFFTPHPPEARGFLAAAEAGFAAAGDRRGELLAEIGAARLAIVERTPDAARERLLALYPESQQLLPPEDRFWLLNAIGAAHYFTDRLDDAIRYLYEALETLRGVERSPQHPTIMSNLAAALVTVGDYAPACELAQTALADLARFDNRQLVLFARSNLAQALAGIGDDARALAAVDRMLAEAAAAPRRAAQNHYMAIAAEIYASNGRLDDAARCADTARAIYADFPGGFNEVHSRWADAVVADARRDAAAITLLREVAEAAQRHRYLPGECNAWARLAERYAETRDFEAAYACSRKLLAAQTQRLSHRASAKYYLLRVEHELEHARAERESLVLKPNRSYGGDGVMVGHAVEQGAWEGALGRALAEPNGWVLQQAAPIPVKNFHVLDAAGEVQVEPFYVVLGFASNRYGVAMLARASQSRVVNVAQHGGVCAVMVGAQAMHTREFRVPSARDSVPVQTTP